MATWAIVNGHGGVVIGIEQHAHPVGPPGCAGAAGPCKWDADSMH